MQLSHHLSQLQQQSQSVLLVSFVQFLSFLSLGTSLKSTSSLQFSQTYLLSDGLITSNPSYLAPGSYQLLNMYCVHGTLYALSQFSPCLEGKVFEFQFYRQRISGLESFAKLLQLISSRDRIPTQTLVILKQDLANEGPQAKHNPIRNRFL